MTLRFTVKYPEEYPEVLPEMDLEPVEGEWENDEYNELMEDLRSVVRLPLVALHSCARTIKLISLLDLPGLERMVSRVRRA